jgi:hypothetical protein
MTAVHRTIAIVTVSAGLAMFGGAASAHAQTKDEQFAADVSALNIPTGDVDLPALGHGICDMLTGGLTGNPNPVPVVRGVVSKLENDGNISKPQAAGLMRAAVSVYCPQHARYMGR